MTLELMAHRHCLDCGAILEPMDESQKRQLDAVLEGITRCDPRRCEGCCAFTIDDNDHAHGRPIYDFPPAIELGDAGEALTAAVTELALLRNLERQIRSHGPVREALDSLNRLRKGNTP